MKLERLAARKLFDKVEQLFRTELMEKGIPLTWPSNCDIELVADLQMLEQVLINLM